jgi:hypothetical protein
VQRRPSDKPLTELHALGGRLLPVPDGEFHVQLLRCLVEQEDAEGAIVDQALCEARDACQQDVEIEDRGHFAADFGKCLERVDVLTLRPEQAGIFNRDGDVGRKLAQQRLILARECAGGFAQQVQRADDFALAAHRHRELRQHVPQRPHVARLMPDVIHEDRSSFLDRRAYHALPHPETLGRGHTVGIADRIRDAQLLARFIEEIHGKGVEARQPRDELWNLGKELFEVEHGHDFAPEVEER